MMQSKAMLQKKSRTCFLSPSLSSRVLFFNIDHVETLFELDIEYGALAKEKGIGYKRVESLNDDPMFIEAMGDIVKNHIVDGKSTSKQMMLRCPSCINEACGHTKEFFGSR